ncbi:hypothetical protein K435DRAFT_929093 [Dendrothele bispora CBS 962.96]|uniref:Uncharacterized protein n=1 Tax=Dendrothele bispora (strain CBS 962.96) TaxID=1314807 RepID=A0A4V4HCN6_DENBC|nr:hypothetical protein K435DRAFT_929093 [Dendrothele bispora CBS 962.96]
MPHIKQIYGLHISRLLLLLGLAFVAGNAGALDLVSAFALAGDACTTVGPRLLVLSESPNGLSASELDLGNEVHVCACVWIQGGGGNGDRCGLSLPTALLELDGDVAYTSQSSNQHPTYIHQVRHYMRKLYKIQFAVLLLTVSGGTGPEADCKPGLANTLGLFTGLSIGEPLGEGREVMEGAREGAFEDDGGGGGLLTIVLAPLRSEVDNVDLRG